MIHENIMYGYDYDLDTNTIIARNQIRGYGFFSTFTLMISAIMRTYNYYGHIPSKIDGKNILRNLCSDDSYDMYSHFFHISEDIDIKFDIPMPVPLTNDDQHTIYKNDFSKYYVAFYKKYFCLNKHIEDKVNELLLKYNIDSDNTLSVVYRSTDKWTDFGGFNYLSPALYLKLSNEILEKNPELKVLIQSESSSINHVFERRLNAKFIRETRVSENDGLPIFLQNIEDKLSWAEYYLASLIIHSKSKYLITYTGNSSFFLYLSRGNTNNLYQEITFTKINTDDFFKKNN